MLLLQITFSLLPTFSFFEYDFIFDFPLSSYLYFPYALIFLCVYTYNIHFFYLVCMYVCTYT